MLWFCSDYTKQPGVDCYIHLKDCFAKYAFGEEPSPAECTAMRAGTTACESACAAILSIRTYSGWMSASMVLLLK